MFGTFSKLLDFIVVELHFKRESNLTCKLGVFAVVNYGNPDDVVAAQNNQASNAQTFMLLSKFLVPAT